MVMGGHHFLFLNGFKNSSLTSLNLSENSFRGKLPVSSLAKLHKLQSFRATGNFLAGPLPPHLFQHWKGLKVLVLTDNLLTGPLPVEALVCLPKLERLEVARNIGLRGELPLLFVQGVLARLR
jgi:hypothetical protein